MDTVKTYFIRTNRVIKESETRILYQPAHFRRCLTMHTFKQIITTCRLFFSNILVATGRLYKHLPNSTTGKCDCACSFYLNEHLSVKIIKHLKVQCWCLCELIETMDKQRMDLAQYGYIDIIIIALCILIYFTTCSDSSAQVCMYRVQLKSNNHCTTCSSLLTFHIGSLSDYEAEVSNMVRLVFQKLIRNE